MRYFRPASNRTQTPALMTCPTNTQTTASNTSNPSLTRQQAWTVAAVPNSTSTIDSYVGHPRRVYVCTHINTALWQLVFFEQASLDPAALAMTAPTTALNNHYHSGTINNSSTTSLPSEVSLASRYLVAIVSALCECVSNNFTYGTTRVVMWPDWRITCGPNSVQTGSLEIRSCPLLSIMRPISYRAVSCAGEYCK